MVCSNEVSRETITVTANGHSYESVTTLPNCTNRGYTTHTCHCGDTYVDTYVNALGHTEAIDKAIEPTCTSTGLTMGIHCSVCNEVLIAQEIVGKLEHAYSENLVFNNTHHYYECVCGAKKDEEQHKSSGAATPEKDEICTDCGYVINKAVGIKFNTLTLNGNKVFGKVSSDTELYSFIGEVVSVGGATYVVSYKLDGGNVITTKTLPLNVGDNTVYITEYINDEPTNIYTVTIRRRPTYEISFDSKGGNAINSIIVDEDTVLTAPEVARPGYTLVSWDYDFSAPITKDTHITANWKANTNTYYKVEYYLENLTKDGYELKDTVGLSGITDTTAIAEQKIFPHFTFNADNSVMSGNIDGNGTLVLKVYYTRDTYTISTSVSNSNGGYVTAGSTYPYGTEISLSVSINAGYTFGGYKIAGNVVCNTENYRFTVSEDADIVADITANSNTKYIVEYYLANIESGYTMVESVELYGTTDTTAFAEQKTFEHFTLWTGSSSVLSGNIAGNGSLVLKLYYTRNSYDIYTNTNNNKGGDYEQICATYYYGVTIPLTATTNPGYKFLGWYEGDTLVCETTDFVVTLNKNVTYTAKWEANANTAYKVEYYFENLEKDGYELKEVLELEGTTDTITNADIKNYEHFVYYADVSNTSGNIDGNGTLVLKVYYQRNEYEVITDINNDKAGTVSNGAEYAYGSSIELVASSNPGYTFLGWFEGNTKVCETLKLAIIVERNVTYTAKWQANTNTAYKVEYYLENIAKDGYELSRTDVLYGTTDTNAIVDTIFEHFALNSALSTTQGNISGNGTLVLKVYYTRDTYTISTATNNTKGGNISGRGTYSYNSVVTLTATTNAGYTFLGWYNGDEKVCDTSTFTFNATESASYTAKWSANTNTEYKVEYYLENIAKDGYELVDTDELTGTTDTTATAEQIAYEHFMFKSDLSTVSGNINGNGTLVLRLYYTRNTYTVTTATENNKAGSVTSGKTAPYGTELTVTATTNPGYTWLGWYNGNTLVSGNATYTFTVSKTVTLTAKWSVNTDTFYTVEYYLQNINDDNYSLEDSETINGSTDSLVNANVKTYAGFAYNASLSTISGNIKGDGTLVLKVYYTRNSYTVSSRSNNTKGGSVTAGGTFKYGKSITLTATTNPGYAFLGWYNGNSLVSSTEAYTFNVEKNVTLTAKWEANETTKYVVEYYLENLSKTGYDLYESSTLYGTTDTTANADVKEYAHFVYKLSASTVSGNINGNGTLVLKVYYTRNIYTVITGAENAKAGNVTSGGTYSYNTTVILTATTNPGYTFLGWYEGDALVCEGEQFVFNADHSGNYTAKWDANTETPYSVEYYLENINKNGYDLLETENLSGTTDTTVNAIIKTFNHFAYNVSASMVSGNVDGNGTLVLKVYYTRNVYIATADANNSKAGSVSGGGSYNYGKEITLTASTNPGYTFLGWYNGNTKLTNELSYTFVSDKNVTYTAKWEANTNTVYKVEYYLENTEKNGYDLVDTANLNGTTDTTATADIKAFEHFKYNASSSTASGNVYGNGSLVLKVYYTRNVYTVSMNDGSMGTITNSGSHTYCDGLEVVLKASVSKLGYSFVGWYSAGELLSKDTEYRTVVDRNIEARFALSSAMQNFYFTSTATECSITGIKDKTVLEIIVPDYITSIAEGAFSGCSSLESIQLPFVGGSANATTASATTLFGYIFGTTSFENATETYQFYSDSNATTYYIPDSLVNVSVSGGEIFYGAFYRCTNLKNIILPNDITILESKLFYDCINLERVTIPDGVKTIGYQTFYYCVKLRNVNIPSSVTSIYSEAFYYCRTLGSIAIPDSVTSMGKYVFYGCEDVLIMCESEKEPSGWNSYWDSSNYSKSIVWNAIAGKTTDGFLWYETNNTVAVYGYEGAETDLIIPNAINGNPVVKIATKAFYNHADLTSVSIPEGVTTIGSCAFQGLVNITKIVVPNTVVSIGEAAFKGCDSLEDITLPFVGESATSTGYTSLFGYIFGYEEGVHSKIDGMIWQYAYQGGAYNYWFYWCYYIPKTIKSVTITSQTTIPDYAFSMCDFIENIVLPNNVECIGKEAFYNCDGLTEINLGTCLTTIGESAFASCASLESITMPDSVESIGKSAFSSSLKRLNSDIDGVIVLPTNLKVISSYMFSGCTGITKVVVGNIIQIQGYAFAGCENITQFNSDITGELIIPSGVTGIGGYAFQGLKHITKIIVPDSVTGIGDGAFKGCDSLEDITLPFVGESVTSTGYTSLFGYIFGYDESAPEGTVCQRSFRGGAYNYLFYWSYYIPKTIKSVTITSQTTIPDYAFRMCSFIESITVKSNASFGTEALLGCNATIKYI